MKAENTIHTILLILLRLFMIPALPFLIFGFLLESFEHRMYYDYYD